MPEYSLVSSYNRLPKKTKQMIELVMHQHFPKVERPLINSMRARGTEFLGILHGKELLGFVIFYSLCDVLSKKKSCDVRVVWSKPLKNSVKFRQEFQVTPAQYLLEHMARKGYELFSYEYLQGPGKKFVYRLAKQGLIKTSQFDPTQNTQMVTDYGQQQVRSRKQIRLRRR